MRTSLLVLEHLLFLWNIETPFTVWRGGSLPGSDHRCASFESLSGPARFADSNRGSNRGPDSPDSDHYGFSTGPMTLGCGRG